MAVGLSSPGETTPSIADTTSRAPRYPLFAVDKAGGPPCLELGKPNPAIPFTEGPCAVYGRYTADSKISFDGKCQNPWSSWLPGQASVD